MGTITVVVHRIDTLETDGALGYFYQSTPMRALRRKADQALSHAASYVYPSSFLMYLSADTRRCGDPTGVVHGDYWDVLTQTATRIHSRPSNSTTDPKV